MSAELADIESFVHSALWKWTRSYLLFRREQLFRDSVTETNQLWKKEGALHEINRLLDAPMLILQWYKESKGVLPDTQPEPLTPAKRESILAEDDWTTPDRW
jgi:hypothetical protein